MLGATMVESGDDRAVTARAAMELLSAAYALHPALAEAEITSMASGLRPAFADNVPALVRQGETLHLNGLYRHGFLLSPAVAAMAAGHLETGSVPEFMDEVCA